MTLIRTKSKCLLARPRPKNQALLVVVAEALDVHTSPSAAAPREQMHHGLDCEFPACHVSHTKAIHAQTLPAATGLVSMSKLLHLENSAAKFLIRSSSKQFRGAGLIFMELYKESGANSYRGCCHIIYIWQCSLTLSNVTHCNASA